MSLTRRALALVFAMLMMSGLNSLAWAADDDNQHDDMDEDECELLQQMKAPTVYGGTGLFNTYSTRTLDEGEWSVGFFWNNFDRDPGDIDINQATANFTVGFTERWEWWVNWNVWQQTTVRQPFLLSGTGYNAVIAAQQSPFDFFGPAFDSGSGAAFFPGTYAWGGGILPALGIFGEPILPPGVVVIDAFGQPGGASGLGPAIVTDRPSYYPDLPFAPQVDFLGFDAFQRPAFGVRKSGNGTGDVSTGTKIELLDPDDNWFSIAVGATLKIPTARSQQAMARGRTNGEVEAGPFLAFGQEWADGHLRLYENVSYTWVADVKVGDVTVLDLPNKLGLGIGLSVAPNEHWEIIGEANYTEYVGGHTPNLLENDPIDLLVGARWFFLEGQLSFGGAYRAHLNYQDDVTLPVLNYQGVYYAPPATVVPIPYYNFANVTFNGEDHHGFVAYVGIGGRHECEEPIKNQPPVCSGVTSDRGEVYIGDSVGLRANASDPDGDPLVYTWSATCGRIVGSGPNVTFDATGLNEGPCTVTAQVDDGHGHVVDCSVVVNVVKRPNVCPDVRLSANMTTVREGELVTFTAMANDPDNGPGPISYNWATTAGSVRRESADNVVSMDTTGLGDTTITVSVTVSDGDPNCADTESLSVVVEKKEMPVLVPISPCPFPKNSARIDNACKQILDDCAIRMQNDPRLILVIDGHSAAKERAGIALKRAENARAYLVNEKGIDANRITTRTYDDKCSVGTDRDNRRVEMNLVPPGLTADDIQKNCVTP